MISKVTAEAPMAPAVSRWSREEWVMGNPGIGEAIVLMILSTVLIRGVDLLAKRICRH
jgi:hypothetical protein